MIEAQARAEAWAQALAQARAQAQAQGTPQTPPMLSVAPVPQPDTSPCGKRTAHALKGVPIPENFTVRHNLCRVPRSPWTRAPISDRV